jgi:hypothetical protein
MNVSDSILEHTVRMVEDVRAVGRVDGSSSPVSDGTFHGYESSVKA